MGKPFPLAHTNGAVGITCAERERKVVKMPKRKKA